MATQSFAQPTYRGNFYGLKTPTFGGREKPAYKETASQTYSAGDLIYQDTNGTIAICTTSSSQHNSLTTGQATKAATGTTGASVHFRPIIPGDLYNFNIFHTTVASAVGTDALIGAVKGLYWNTGAFSTTTNSGSASQWAVDMINSVEGAADALARVRVIDCPQRRSDGTLNAITDIYARVTCIFLTYSLASDGNPNQRLLTFGS